MLRPVLLASALALAVLLPAAPAAAAPAVWLCHPALKSDACRVPLSASLLGPGGAPAGVQRMRPARRPKIDCFYVYPTVSGQPTANANLAIENAQRNVARFQAARFTSACRMFAPMYRQITVKALATPGMVTAQVFETALADVRAAWREYLRRYNRGRGVILIGHSQGTFMLRRLVAERIDPAARERRRLVGAYLIGGDVTVAKGSDRGGDFRRIPACRRATQTGCVVAYSAWNAPVPADARFGRVRGAQAAGREVLCTNPAALGGGSGALKVRLPAGLPGAPQPWTGRDGGYRGRCANEGGANVLQVETLPGAPRLSPSPAPSWGLHRLDVNLALGNLVDLARRQGAAYVRRR